MNETEELVRYLASLAAQPRFTQLDPPSAVRAASELLEEARRATAVPALPRKAEPEDEIDAMTPPENVPASAPRAGSGRIPPWPLVLNTRTQQFVRRSDPSQAPCEGIGVDEFLDAVVGTFHPRESSKELKSRVKEFRMWLRRRSEVLPELFTSRKEWYEWVHRYAKFAEDRTRAMQKAGGRKGLRRRRAKAKKRAQAAKYAQ